jgi:hypothetical protein
MDAFLLCWGMHNTLHQPREIVTDEWFLGDHFYLQKREWKTNIECITDYFMQRPLLCLLMLVLLSVAVGAVLHDFYLKRTPFANVSVAEETNDLGETAGLGGQ